MAERVASMEVASDILGTVSTLLDIVDWDQLAADISRAEAIGPIVLPSEFAASLGNGTLDSNRAVVEATRTYVAALRRLAPEGLVRG